MKAKCFYCQAGFRFDEAKIQTRAVITCPSCGKKNLLEQKPNSAEPDFFILPYEKGDKDKTPDSYRKAEERKTGKTVVLKASGDESILELDEDKEQKPTLREGARRHAAPEPVTKKEEKLTKEQLQAAQAKKPEPKKDAISAEEKKRLVQTSESVKEKLEQSRQASSATMTDRRYDPRLQRQLQKSMGWDKRYFYSAIVLLVLIVGVLMYGSMGDDKEKTPKKAVGNAEGLQVIEGMKAKYPNVDPQTDYLTAGKEAMALDTPDGYRIAIDSLARAVIANPVDDQAIAAYVEAWILSKKTLDDVDERRKIIDLLAHALDASKDPTAVYLAKTRYFLVTGQLQKAITEVEKAKKRHPDQIATKALVAETELPDNPQMTLKILDSLHQSGTLPRHSYVVLAEAYRELGNFYQAAHILEERRNIEPQYCTNCLMLGQLYESVAQYEKALDIFQKLDEAQASTPDGILGQVGVLYLQGKPLETILAMLESFPAERLNGFSKEDRGRFLVAKTHYQILADDFAGARRTNNKARAMLPFDPQTRYHYVLLGALEHLGEGANADELTTMAESLTRDLPHNPAAWWVRGLLAWKQQNFKQANEFLTKSVKINETFLPGVSSIARFYLEIHEPIKAMQYLSQLGKADPVELEEVPPLNYYTKVMPEPQQLVEAIKSIPKNVIDQDLKYFLLGVFNYYMNDIEGAQYYFRLVFKNDREHPRARLFMGYTFLKQEKFDQAREEAMVVLEKNPKNARVAYLIALSFVRRGEYEQSLRSLERLLEQFPRYVAPMTDMAMIHLRQNRLIDAQEYAKKAYQLLPESRHVRAVRYLVKI